MSPSGAIAQWRTYVERLTSVLVEAEIPDASEATHASLRQVCILVPQFPRRGIVLECQNCYHAQNMSVCLSLDFVLGCFRIHSPGSCRRHR